MEINKEDVSDRKLTGLGYEKRDDRWEKLADDVFKVQQMKRTCAAEEVRLMGELRELSLGKSSYYGKYIFTISMKSGAINWKDIPEIQQMKAEYLEEFRGEDVETKKLDINKLML